MLTKRNLFEIILFTLIFILAFCFRLHLFGIIMVMTTIIYGTKIILKQNFEIKIIVIFILLYNITFLHYFIFDVQISYYTEFNKYEYLYKTLLLCYIFSITFLYQLDKIRSKK